jgi:hypothetical protein
MGDLLRVPTVGRAFIHEYGLGVVRSVGLGRHDGVFAHPHWSLQISNTSWRLNSKLKLRCLPNGLSSDKPGSPVQLIPAQLSNFGGHSISRKT